MKKVISNYRYYVLTLLCVVCCLGVFSVPQEDLPMLYWLWVLVSTKIIGIMAGWLFVVLFKRWDKAGKIQELTEFTNDF